MAGKVCFWAGFWTGMAVMLFLVIAGGYAAMWWALLEFSTPNR